MLILLIVMVFVFVGCVGVGCVVVMRVILKLRFFFSCGGCCFFLRGDWILIFGFIVWCLMLCCCRVVRSGYVRVLKVRWRLSCCWVGFLLICLKWMSVGVFCVLFLFSLKILIVCCFFFGLKSCFMFRLLRLLVWLWIMLVCVFIDLRRNLLICCVLMYKEYCIE